MAVEIKNIYSGYAKIPVLNKLTLDLKEGEILSLVGPNGSGKTTLIRVLSGVLPYRGSIKVDGNEIAELTDKDRSKMISVIPQAQYLGGAFTVFETVMLGRTPYLNWLGKLSDVDLKIIDDSLVAADLTQKAKTKIANLSGGEQQRVWLARALTQKASVMLLDEPTNNLDIKYQIDFLSLIRDLVDQMNLTVMMAIHDLNLASRYSDQVALLYEGEIKQVGSPAEVLNLENLEAIYGIGYNVIEHPDYDIPLIVPPKN